jgi:hypothetical protein
MRWAGLATGGETSGKKENAGPGRQVPTRWGLPLVSSDLAILPRLPAQLS